MKPSKICVLIEYHNKPAANPDTCIIRIQELVRWIKSGHYWRHLFRYKQSSLMTNNWEALTEPFGTALAMRLLSRGVSSIHDANGNATAITLPLLFRLFKSFVGAYLRKPGFLRQKLGELEQITKSLQTSATIKSLDLTLPPVYLRTDYVVDLKAGGSVGHTAGVLNHLSSFTAPPLFLTSIPIPTVNRNIETHVIPPSGRFMDFREIMYLDYNDHLRQTTDVLLKDRRPAFIYQRYSTNNYFGRELAQKMRVPFILEYNGSEVWINKIWSKPLKYEEIAEQIEMINLCGADVVVVVSQPLKSQLVERGVESEKILVNPNGVDPNLYFPDMESSNIRDQFNLGSKTVIGFIGTFGKWHGAEVLAKAYGLLLKTYPEYRKTTQLLMVGDGVTMPQVKNEIEFFHIADNVILTGMVPQEEGPEHLAACDILASPHVPNSDGTPFFGSPTKLFEYMAMGKGIVASDLDQIGEVLQHDHTARLVKPGDAESLMHGLKSLIDNPETRKRLGEAARREVVAKYTWKEHTRKIIEKLKERCPCD
ncbi:MAG: glycosyltransferase family 4 protein [Nitrospinae bacterium]|nr:glycosyltransferase family 4 protein [Nitrospinota bacterium]